MQRCNHEGMRYEPHASKDHRERWVEGAVNDKDRLALCADVRLDLGHQQPSLPALHTRISLTHSEDRT